MLRRATTKGTIPRMGIERIETGEIPKKLEPNTSLIKKIEPTGMETAVSFAAMLAPFLGFCLFHHVGYFGKSLDRIAKSRFGVQGFLALPFLTLSMEKSIYDTVQCLQGIDPNVVPEGRGGFPSGGAGLPSFSLVALRKRD